MDKQEWSGDDNNNGNVQAEAHGYKKTDNGDGTETVTVSSQNPLDWSIEEQQRLASTHASASASITTPSGSTTTTTTTTTTSTTDTTPTQDSADVIDVESIVVVEPLSAMSAGNASVGEWNSIVALEAFSNTRFVERTDDRGHVKAQAQIPGSMSTWQIVQGGESGTLRFQQQAKNGGMVFLNVEEFIDFTGARARAMGDSKAPSKARVLSVKRMTKATTGTAAMPAEPYHSRVVVAKGGTLSLIAESKLDDVSRQNSWLLISAPMTAGAPAVQTQD